MPGLSHNSMAAILKLAYRCDAFHNFVSFVVYDGVNLSNVDGKSRVKIMPPDLSVLRLLTEK